METLVFLSGKRTPFGKNGGSLKDVTPTDLGKHASLAALTQAGVDPKEIDHVLFGNIVYGPPNTMYSPRHLGLELGIPESVPALGANRLCGTGFQLVIEAFYQMQAGDTKIALVAAAENMTQAPYLIRGVRGGIKMGNSELTDMMMECLTDAREKMPMAITAENLAEKYKISREETDRFALLSQTRFEAAKKAGRFKDEIVSYSFEIKGKTVVLDSDEHPKPDATLEGLMKLKPVFKKDGVVSAGNASGIVDGGAAMIVSTESEAKRRGAKPLGRLVGYGVSGCDPKIMGIGPVPATLKAFHKTGLSLKDMDIIEVNEAFAVQALSVMKELGIDPEKFNVNGGAVAVGHPIAATGVRITQHALYELIRRKKRYALVSACIGGGQGISLILENMSS